MFINYNKKNPMNTKFCFTYEIEYFDIATIKDIILPIIKNLKPEDYFYLYYDTFFKIGIIGVQKPQVESELVKLKNSSSIRGYRLNEKENTFDISKIMACASCKIVDFLLEILVPFNIDKLVDELCSLPEINADSYVPLHFILNQMRLLDKETEIRFKIKTNPKYIHGYKKLGNIIVR